MIESQIKTKTGFENIKAYSVEEFEPPTLIFKKLQRNHKVIKYATDYICLDTETSKIDEATGWVYQWAVCIKQHIFVYGRKPSEFITFMQNIAEHYQLNDERKIIIYIHNLQYDFSYLKRFIMQYDPCIDVLAIDNHTVLTVDVLGFRFICSYKLTNLSLAVLSDKYAKKYIKAVGEIDYNIVHYQDETLTASDWLYMFSDVASQYDGIKQYLLMNNYTFCADAPFTSTGFVRVACRKASKKDSKWREQFELMRLDLEQYRLCRQAFMGGICICSYRYSNKTIRAENGIKLKHKDFTSSYPARQCLETMPAGKPMWYGAIKSRRKFEQLIAKYHCVFMITLYDVHIKDGVTAPYIPSSKCLAPKELLKINGKVVFAKELTIAITEIDYKWIKRQYTASNFKISKMLCFKRGKMPDWLKAEIMQYFTNKCTLKHSEPVLYAKSKNLLNGIYGMTATSIIREQYKINLDNGIIKRFIAEDIDKQDQADLDRYYRSHNSFMPYQYSLFTTSWARDALMTMIEAVGYDNFLYCDTDSVFYIETPENRERMAIYEKECIDKAIKGGAFVGNNYLGAPTDEPELRAFRGLHSKCYAMEELNEKSGKYELNVVIAGIPKRAVKWIDGKPVTKTNSEELASIDNLKDGFEFVHCGGTRCVYNDERAPVIMDINGHETELATSAVIENISKVISDTMWTFGADYSLLNYTFVTP